MSDRTLLTDIIAQMKPAEKQTEKQKRIVEAAVTIFAEKGYANTSTAEIAKVAEVSEGTIFKHYGTKEKLLLSLLVPYIKEFFPSIADGVLKEITSEKELSFEGFIRAFLNNRIQFFLENREIFQVLVKEIIYREELKNELMPYLFENVLIRMVPLLKSFQERGELPMVPIERLLPMFFTVLGGFFVSRFVLLNRERISPEEVDDVVQFVVAGVRNLK